jgi:hypothetical protein
LIKMNNDRAHLSDRLLSLPPELHASVVQYLALLVFKRIDDPTTASLRSQGQSMLSHLPALICKDGHVKPCDALAALLFSGCNGFHIWRWAIGGMVRVI